MVSKLKAKGVHGLKHWAIGIIALILAWVSYSWSLMLANLSLGLGFVALVIDIIVVPYIVGRIIARTLAIEVFSEKLSTSMRP